MITLFVESLFGSFIFYTTQKDYDRAQASAFAQNFK